VRAAADIVDIAARLAIKDGVCSLVDLRWVHTCQLRREQWSNVLCPAIAELITIAFGRLCGPFRARLNVIDVINLSMNRPLAFTMIAIACRAVTSSRRMVTVPVTASLTTMFIFA
jgi:hypothetical protein